MARGPVGKLDLWDLRDLRELLDLLDLWDLRGLIMGPESLRHRRRQWDL